MERPNGVQIQRRQQTVQVRDVRRREQYTDLQEEGTPRSRTDGKRVSKRVEGGHCRIEVSILVS